jgi:THO complex subunit 1
LKDNGYAARFIFLQPPGIPELSERLRQRGSDDDDNIEARLEIAEKELQQAEVEGFHDKIIVNDDLQNAYDELEKYIFSHEDDVVVEERRESSEVDAGLVQMAFTPAEDLARSPLGEGSMSKAAQTPAEDISSTVGDGE